MPTFFLFDGIKICLYFGDHNPPHFHAFYAEFELLMSISSATVLKGEMPKRQLKKIMLFTIDNKQELLEIWDGLHP